MTTNLIKDGARTFTPPSDAYWLWKSLADESPMPVYVVSRTGTIDYCNAQALTYFRGESDLTVLGKTLVEVMGDDAGKERMEHVNAALASPKYITIDETRRGKRYRCTLRPVPNGIGPSRSVMITATPSVINVPNNNGPILHSKTNDSGKLASLTSREMEILKLIGLGMSTNDIGKHLGRSVKTIEWHRVSLGEKLGVVNRVELARIAIAAGLVGLEEKPPVHSN